MTAKEGIKDFKSGFTLLELICVLFVLSLLFSILMPSLNKAKMAATRVVCASNMKGYGTFFAVYLNDSEGVFPDPEQWIYSKNSDTLEHPIGCRWHDWPMALDGRIMSENKDCWGEMGDYLKEIYISPCPSFRDIAVKMGCENLVHNPKLPIKPQYNFTMNAYLGSDRHGGVKNEVDVYKPATKFLLAEENAWSVRPDHPKYPARWLSAPLSTKALDDTALLITPTPEAENCFATFHDGKQPGYSEGHSNITFLDGHVTNIGVRDQLREKMHAGSSLGSSRYSRYSYSSYEERSPHPGGNLYYAWPLEEPPPGGWEGQ
jgi:prepilin-type N-terminal cleavage/methylation domain-containing protein/prepilin-type processing-associated H-X9-DG protein